MSQTNLVVGDLADGLRRPNRRRARSKIVTKCERAQSVVLVSFGNFNLQHDYVYQVRFNRFTAAG